MSALDIETFLAGLDSPNHSEQSRRDWVALFYRDLRSEAATEARRDLLAKVDLIFGKDGEIITTGVAKERLRMWLQAQKAAADFAVDGTLVVPRGAGDTDV
jgi:hypothetical protein